MSGWFDEQLRARISADEEVFSDAFAELAAPLLDRGEIAEGSAMEEIADYYGVPHKTERIDTPAALFRAGGVMYRPVELSEGWYKDALGVYLARTQGGEAVALFREMTGYKYLDHVSGQRVKLNAQTQHNLKREAVCFYKPLPLRALGVKDLFVYILKSIPMWEIVYIVLLTLGVTLVSMIAPAITRNIYAELIYSGKNGAIVSSIIFIVSAGISVCLLEIARGLAQSRIELRTVRAAVMMRILNLPVEFFRKYSSGDLSQRVSGVHTLCTLGADVILSAGLTAVMSLVYLVQIFSFTPVLVLPALMIVLLLLLLTLTASIMEVKVLHERLELSARENGLLYALITGIQKIRLAGAERRAFAKWASSYKRNVAVEFTPPVYLRLYPALQPSITLLGTFMLYLVAYKARILPADYMAFTVTFGLLSGAFINLCNVTLSMASIGPIVELVKPVLEAEPERPSGAEVLKLRGGIEVNSVTFRYGEKQAAVLDGISFKVRPGEYVAVVGKSGCGKSTLMRLMLGFETPERGVILYDGNDLKTLNVREVRRNIGCVMQNSRLFPGSIYQNITITAPELTEAEAWKAAEAAGIADDIAKMPMKMNTMISEGTGTLSGGQVQRIIIARAIAPKPRILLFDEATSALDNLTQKVVSDSLDSLKCTRFVIAHRLSTVRNCSRILVIDGGKIAEAGTYDELLSKGGIFAALVERQQLNMKEGLTE